MDYHSATSYTSAEKQQLHQRQFENDLIYEQRHDDNAVYLPYLMNKTSLNAVRSCFLHRRVYIDRAARHRPSHPVPASLLWYARNDLIVELAKTSRVIDMGGNLLDTLHRNVSDHVCVMSTSARDRNRYLSQCYSAIGDDIANAATHNAIKQIWSHALGTFRTATSPKFCLAGGQRCRHRAEVLTSIHSIYDMSIADVVRMFQTHGSHTMLIWAYFPPELFPSLHGASAVRAVSGNFNWYTLTQSGDVSSMRFNDATFYYEHNTANWSQWIKFNRIVADDFDLIIEVQEQVGIMFKLRITRTPKSSYSTLAHEIVYPFLAEYVRVPDIYHYVESGDYQVRYNVCPRLFVNRIFNQAYKSVEINANSIHTLATSCITRIDVADTVVNKFVDLDAGALDCIVYSIVLMAAAHRSRRSRDFRWFVDVFSADLHASGNIVERCLISIRRCAESLFALFRGSYAPTGAFDLQVLPFAPIDCVEYYTQPTTFQEDDDDDCVRFPASIHGVAFHREYPVFHPPATINVDEVCEEFQNEKADILVLPCDDEAVETAVVDLNVSSYRPHPPILSIALPPAQTITPAVKRPSDNDLHLYNRPAGDAQVLSFVAYPHFTGDYDLARLPDCEYKLRDRLLPSRVSAGDPAVRKILPIIKHFCSTTDHITLYDVGAGPGAFGVAFKAHYPNSVVHGITYTVPITPLNSRSYATVQTVDIRKYPFQQLTIPPSTTRIVVVCNIGPVDTWLAVASAVYNFVAALAAPNTIFVIKCFLPRNADTQHLLAIFRFVKSSFAYSYHRPIESGEQNSEFYVVGRGVCTPYHSPRDNEIFQLFYDDVEYHRRAAVTLMSSRLAYNCYSDADGIMFDERQFALTLGVLRDFWLIFSRDAPCGLTLIEPKFVTDLKCRIISAVPGAGKSAYMRNRVSGSKLFVVPTCKLRDEYIKHNCRAVTFHTLFTRPYRVDHLIIDEAYTFRLPFVFAAASHVRHTQLWLLGDHYQIGAIDFSTNRDYEKFDRIPNAAVYNSHSMTMPQDIAQLCTGAGYPNVTTSSRVFASVNYIDVGPESLNNVMFKIRNAVVMCFNQSTVDRLALISVPAVTIHEAQGSRPESVIFYYDQAAIDSGLYNSVEHLRVMWSRHTDKLVFVGQTQHMRRLIDYYGSNISINMDRYLLSLRDADLHTDTIRLNGAYNRCGFSIAKYNDPPLFSSATVDQVCDILSHILPASTEPSTSFATLIQTTIPYHGSGKLVIKLERIIEKMRSVSVAGWMTSHQSFALRHFPTSMAVLKCLGDRYTKVTPEIADVADSVVMLLNSLSRIVIPYDVNDYPPLVTSDDFANSIISRLDAPIYTMLSHLQRLGSIEGMFEHHLVEYFRALDVKILPRDQFDRELTDARDFWLKFFPKRQVKPKLADGYECSDKAPQGIAAFEKNVNMLFAAYGRMLSQFTDQLFQTNVIFASNHSEAELSARIAAAFADVDADELLRLERSATDFAEFDSTQSRPAFALMSVFYAVLGAPPVLLDRYRTVCAKWVMSDDAVRLHGVLKMHSGSFETLVRNSYVGLTNNCVVFRWQTLIIILFKGDDFEIEGFGLEFVPGSWLRDHRLSIKNESPPVGEFAGKFILPQGSCPDVLRRCVKYLSTIYKSTEHHQESIISLNSEFDCITSQAHLEAAIVATVRFYARPGILSRPPTESDIRIMFDFLHTRAHDLKPQLFDVVLPIAHYSTAAATCSV